LYIFCRTSFDQVWYGYFSNLTKQILILTYGLEEVWEHMTESYITISKVLSLHLHGATVCAHLGRGILPNQGAKRPFT